MVDHCNFAHFGEAVLSRATGVLLPGAIQRRPVPSAGRRQIRSIHGEALSPPDESAEDLLSVEEGTVAQCPAVADSLAQPIIVPPSMSGRSMPPEPVSGSLIGIVAPGRSEICSSAALHFGRLSAEVLRCDPLAYTDAVLRRSKWGTVGSRSVPR